MRCLNSVMHVMVKYDCIIWAPLFMLPYTIWRLITSNCR
jgi:hypothetical protein